MNKQEVGSVGFGEEPWPGNPLTRVPTNLWEPDNLFPLPWASVPLFEKCKSWTRCLILVLTYEESINQWVSQ